MKMLIAIVREHLLADIADGLLEEGVKITKLSSTGGFLQQKNVTLLLGVEDEQVDKVKEIFQDKIPPNTDGHFGANVFVIDPIRGLSL